MALKISPTQKIVGLVILTMVMGAGANIWLSTSQNSALLRGELKQANVTVAATSTEQLAGGIRFGKPETILATYAGLKALLGQQFAAGASFDLQGVQIVATEGSETYAGDMAALAKTASAADTAQARENRRDDAGRRASASRAGQGRRGHGGVRLGHEREPGAAEPVGAE